MGRATVDCTANDAFTILAGMPHMHEIGDSYSHTLTRARGATESVIELGGGSFDLQFFCEMNVQVNVGDTTRLVCNYRRRPRSRFGSAQSFGMRIVLIIKLPLAKYISESGCSATAPKSHTPNARSAPI
jgi:hypothetical protein